MLAVARACQSRGHEVTIYTTQWQGEKPTDMHIVELPVNGLTNHGKGAAFFRRFHEIISTQPDCVVIGFNKMPGLDVYYAADVCFAHKAFAERSFFYRMMPRSRQYLAFEDAVFGVNSKTQVLIIAKTQIPVFQYYYHTPDNRLQLLAPGIRRTCIMPENYDAQRCAVRAQQQLTDSDLLILFVGSDYSRKGLDRALRGIAALEEPLRKRVKLWVVGQDNQEPFVKQARSLGIEDKVHFLGARDDIPQLMWSADLLLHPAYSEAAGIVLLEAMVAGLPVIASSVCGYAHYINDYQMGRVLEGALTPPEIAAAITMVFAEPGAIWQERSRRMTQQADIFSMPERAAEIIESVGREKRERTT